ATVNATLARTNDTTYTVTFSEKVDKTTAETATNYPVTGTCLAPENPSAAVLQANGVDVVLTISTTVGCHVTGASTVIVTPAATITDVAGVAITPSAATYTLLDTTAPTIISITMPGTPFKVGDTPTLTIVFSEAVASFANADLTTIEGGTLTPVATADNITWTSTFTPTDPLLDTTNIITVDATGLTDTPALNPGTGTMSTANFVVDTIEPTVTITDDQTGTASDVDNTVLYTFEFSEDVQNFATADVSVTAGGTKGDFTATDANTYTVLVTATDGSTTNISITAAAAAFTDLNGNAMAGDATNAAQVVDTVNPTVLITDDEGDNVVRDANTVLVTATFSEAMTSAPTVSIDVSTGADADISAAAMTATGDPAVWTYSWNVPAGHSDDTAVVTVAGSDLNGNTYGGATHDDFIIDNTAPVISAGADAGEKTALFTHVDPSATDGTGQGLATYAWSKVSGLGTITFSSAATLNPGNISVTAGAYDNYVARLTVTDVAGNSSTDDFTFSWLPATGLVATIWSPAGSATGVAIAVGTTTVTFNSNITLLDATKVTIKKNSDNSSVANGAASVSGGNGTSAILDIPYSVLANSTMYRINIAQNAVRDADGNTNAAAVSYFTTTAVTDITDPTVTAQTPVNGAASQAITVSPTVTFSEAMDATTVNTNTVQLRALTGDAIINSVVTYDVSSHVATIDPVASLSNSTSYYVWVSGAKDVAGNTVTAYTTGADQDFGTVAAGAAPTVTAQTPVNGAASQAITVSPTVTFSEAMDATTVNTNTVQLRALTGDAIINSVVTYTGTTATIDPVDSLANGTSYYVWVSGAKNAAGTTMTAYTTGADQDFGTVALGNGTLAVTGISSIETFAAVAGGWPDGDSSTADGWSWTFDITVPTTETSFAMKFANWASGSNTIAAASNIRFFTAQASANADADHARLITVAGTDSTAITLTSDLDAATAGRQIQVTVQAQIPTGSAAGSYSTQYGVTSN
ncbi:MAG: Ig-like domain-containing protein, partial [Patescibacteria group bacterium]